jgi:hypothetical protein
VNGLKQKNMMFGKHYIKIPPELSNPQRMVVGGASGLTLNYISVKASGMQLPYQVPFEIMQEGPPEVFLFQ